MDHPLLAWMPLHIAVVWTMNLFVQNFSGERSLEKRVRWQKQQERGLNLFGDISGRFSDPCSRFSYHIWYKYFQGQFLSADVPP